MSAKRALLLALGEFPADRLPDHVRDELAAKVLAVYRDHPDSLCFGKALAR